MLPDHAHRIAQPFRSLRTESAVAKPSRQRKLRGSVWSQTFSYDAFGNITKTGSESFNPGYTTATNHMMTGATYDAMGDVVSDSLHSYAWNSDTRPTAIDTATVTYDALGRMVEQSKAGANTEIQYSPTGFVMQLMNGQTWVKEFVPMPGGTEEVWQATGASPYYRHADWLGSSRFASTYSTRAMYNDLAYAPFGEQYAQSGSTGVTDTSFAGNDENTVTNLYDAQFREYGIQGRWPSPDPSGIKAVDPRNPQSWNRYAYALNNPLRAIDPSGLDCVYLDDVGDDVEWIDPNSNPDECGGGGGYWIPGTVDPDSIVIDSDNGWIEATSNTGLGTFASGCQGAGCGNDPNGFSYSASTFSNSAFAQPGQGVSAWYNADPNTGQSTGVAGLSSYQQYFNSMNQDQWNATQFGNFFSQPFMDIGEGCYALSAAGVVASVAPGTGPGIRGINFLAALAGLGCSNL